MLYLSVRRPGWSAGLPSCTRARSLLGYSLSTEHAKIKSWKFRYARDFFACFCFLLSKIYAEKRRSLESYFCS